MVAGSGVKPALINSLTPLGNSQLASEVCCTISKVTMLMATSGTSSKFSKVCLVVLFLILRTGEKTTMGGLDEKRLKKLKGLRFTFPFLSIVEAKHIGRGAIKCWR